MRGCFTSLLLFVWSFGFGQEVKLGLPLGHTDGILSGYFDVFGKRILTGSSDKTARLWDIETGKLIHIFSGHTSYVWSAKFDVKAKIVITNSYDGTTKFWNPNSGKLLKSFEGHTSSVETAFYLPNYGFLLTGSSDNTAKLWNTSNESEIQTFSGHEDAVVGAEFHPDMQMILTASDDGSAKTWDLKNGKLRTTFSHQDAVNSAIFNKNGNFILTASSDNTAAIWDTESGERIAQFLGHQDKVMTAVFGPSEKTVLTTSYDHTARIWDVKTGTILVVLEGHEGVVDSAIFNKDGSKVLTASWDKTAKIWDTRTGMVIQNFAGHKRNVRSAVFSPDENYILTVSSDDSAKIWEVSSGMLSKSFEGYTHQVNSAEFDDVGQRFVASYDDKTARVWNAIDGSLEAILEGHKGRVSKASFNKDGNLVLTASWDGTSKLWDSNLGTILNSFDEHDRVVTTAVFGPQDLTVLTTSWDKTAKLWERDTSKLLQSFEGHSEWIQDGDIDIKGEKVVTASSDNTVKIWDVHTGECTLTFKGHTSSVHFVRFFDNDKKVISSSADKKIKIWDVDTGKTLKTFVGHKGRINDVVLHENGKEIISASDDNSVRIWNVESAKEIRKIKGHLEEVNSVVLNPKKNTVLTASEDGSIIISGLKDGKTMIRQFIFEKNPEKWVHLHPSGLFDASPEAMELMYYTYGLEVIEFQQLKELYWEPGLWQKVMKNEPLRDVPSKEKLKNYLPPKVEYPRQLAENSYTIPVTITKREGGLGKIRVYVNGVEISHSLNKQVNPALTVQELELVLDPKKDLPNGKNSISIIAETANGKVTSSRGAVPVANNKNFEDPSFYGVIIGVGDYPEDNYQNLDLQFAEKDVQAMDKALKLATPSLFQKRNFYNLSTLSKNVDSLPSKTNIEKVFLTIAEKAGPNDVIWVHFSGHGKAIAGDGSEDKDIHLLLNDWINIDMDSPNANELVSQRSISGEELKEMLKKIKANKRVVVLDACEAGSFYNEKSGGNTIAKSLDRLRTASGAAMIMGSQEDQSSYETSNYEMGLLTYSLLEGMKNTPLSSPINSLKILQHAEERVQDLAEELGVKQQPKIIGTANFPFGSLDENTSKSFPSLRGKPVIKAIRLTSKTNTTRDPLRLTEKVTQAIKDYVAGDDEVFSYFNIDSGSEDYYTLAGHYFEDENGKLVLELDLHNQEDYFPARLVLLNENEVYKVVKELEAHLRK